jgi:uracil-DNA glycosylase
MATDSISKELLSLIEGTREHLKYLHELGVERVEIATNTSRGSIQQIVVTKDAELKEPISPPYAASRIRRGADIATAIYRPPEAPKGEHQAKLAPPPLPQVSLFADLSPQADTLPQSTETFEEIWADIGNCTRCPLSQGRTNIVHTEGSRKARLMFVGEAPGADEDAQARPFVGRAGQLLTKIIEALGMKREDVLIGNVNRCRPPGNRTPTPEEVSMCKPFLLREIAAAQPEVIVVLGNTAMKNLLDTREGITKLRGQIQDYKGIKVMPTFHPAYLLRDPAKKKETWEDLKKVRDYLDSEASRGLDS